MAARARGTHPSKCAHKHKKHKSDDEHEHEHEHEHDEKCAGPAGGSNDKGGDEKAQPAAVDQ